MILTGDALVEIITTEDGSNTLFVPELREYYHSIHGAIQESNFIFIDCGLDFSDANPVRIFEMGFGTGLNVLLAGVYALAHDREIFYTSIEKYPLSEGIIQSLNYTEFVEYEFRQLYKQIHSCNWNLPEKLSDNLTLLKINGDFITYVVPESFDLIYYDAFGPDKQPEMWTEIIFKKISVLTAKNGIFVTYSVKGEVQRNLRKNGFDVSLLPGPPGKRQILRAVKI